MGVELKMSRQLLAVIGASAAVLAIAVGVVWTYSPNLIELLLGTQEQKVLRPKARAARSVAHDVGLDESVPSGRPSTATCQSRS